MATKRMTCAADPRILASAAERPAGLVLRRKLITNPAQATDELICRTAGIAPQELAKARQIEADRNAPKGMMAMMMVAAAKQDKDDKNKKMVFLRNLFLRL